MGASMQRGAAVWLTWVRWLRGGNFFEMVAICAVVLLVSIQQSTCGVLALVNDGAASRAAL